MTKQDVIDFYKLVSMIKKPENYKPRNYRTIGGGWATDRWELNGVVYLSMDEGYTNKIIFNNSNIVQGYNGKEYIEFNFCDSSVFEQIYKIILTN